MMKVIGYTRVSTEEQANSGHSLAAQRTKLQGYADLYDLEIVEMIEDGGFSAKNLNRPGIQRALQMVREGQAQGILIMKLDRMTRNLVDLNTLLSDYFGEKAKYAASLFSVGEQVDTRSASGRLVLNMLMSVAQWERETIGERTKIGMAQAKAEGKRICAPAMGETPDEIKTLEYINQLAAEGLTLQAIADRLQAEGFKTKRGGKWYPSTVKNYIKAA